MKIARKAFFFLAIFLAFFYTLCTFIFYFHTMKCKLSLEKQVLIFAGIMVNLFMLLSIFAHPFFIFGTNLVGIMLIIYATTGFCPAQIVFSKMPWNK